MTGRARLTCPDCSAYLEWWDGFLRCPWATKSGGRSVRAGDLPAIACNKPYSGRRNEITAPIKGRTTT
jgi:hypothetical protein